MSDHWNSGVTFSSLTDVGMRRINNQDSVACVPATNEDRFQYRGHLFVVADGMGAHAAGELASEMATEKIAMHYFRSLHEDSTDALHAAVAEANAAIYRRGQSNPEFHNMGTTASALALLPCGALVAHVGDSRVYRLRNSVLEQLTFDHSLVWEMEASAELTGTSVGAAIPRNVITRSLGPHEKVEIDLEGPFPVLQGDQFLICSDGLTGLVEDTEIGVLLDCLPEQLATRVLVDLANLRGGPDNISVIIVRVGDQPQPVDAIDRQGPSRQPTATPLLIAATIACLAGAGILAALPLASWGPVVVAVMLGMVAATTSIFSYLRNRRSGKGPVVASGGKGPYRRYDARPSKDLYDRLGATVDALREAAQENNWMMDWSKVNRHQSDGAASLNNRDMRGAIRCQSEAIVETMNQLREQHDRAASETAADQL